MTENYHGILIDRSRDSLLTEQSAILLKKYYMKKGETSPQEAYARASLAYSYGDMGLAQRIYDYVSKQWFMFASPVLSNAPIPGDKAKSMPISCFLTYVPDTLEGLISHTSELRWLSVMGGGVGGHWSAVRSVSDIAPGPVPFIHTVDADMQAYKQGTTRKGAYAAYLDVSHPDIEEFLNLRVPGGDTNRKAFNIHNAINISDKFMQAVESNSDWNLIDPKTKEVKKTLSARKLWERILTVRYRTGEPYLFFIDEAKRKLPSALSDIGLEINGSNLCIEITLPTSWNRTAVCCLSSINGRKYREWQPVASQFIGDLVEFLDNVLQFFVDNAPSQLENAVRGAAGERSLGLGLFGFHALLQSELISIDSQEAFKLNEELFKTIYENAVMKSTSLGKEKGYYPDLIKAAEVTGYAPRTQEEFRRNAHLIALAPNANSASLAGTSPSIEMWRSNAYVHDTRAGTHVIKNPELVAFLEAIGYNTDEVWKNILANNGSVVGLDFLPDDVKKVFSTASEVDQNVIVDLAAERQKYVCQSQSLNVYFPAKAKKEYVNSVHLRAWKKKLKSLYYCRTDKSNKIEKTNLKIERIALPKQEESACVACEA